MVDLGFSGQNYTWSRGVTIDRVVSKRLDRFLLIWMVDCVGRMLGSDTYLDIRQTTVRSSWRLIRTLLGIGNAALFGSTFPKFLYDNWKRDAETPKALMAIKIGLRKWNSEVFSNIMVRKRKLMTRLDTIQRESAANMTPALLTAKSEMIRELDLVLNKRKPYGFKNLEKTG